MKEQKVMILYLVSGERIIGECSDNGLFWDMTDVFTLQEMFEESNTQDSIMSQLSLISFTAYSESNAVSIPKQFVICCMEPNKYIRDIHSEEARSIAEQKREKKEKEETKSKDNVTQFKKRH